MTRKLLVLLFLTSTLITACGPAQTPVVEAVQPSATVFETIGPIETQNPTATFTLFPTLGEGLPSATFTPSPEPTPVTPPGIILFIGDGMGEYQRLAATWKASGQGGLLMMDNLPVHGMAQTATSDGMITDSGASATSIASGVITNYMAVGVDAAGAYVNTILELAQANGWSVGLVTTTSLAHATPAAFAAHVPNREDRDEIARQMMAHHLDVMLGGGEDDFFSINETGCFPGVGIQPAGTALIADAIADGYTYVCGRDQLLGLDISSVDHLIGLFGADEMPRPYAPTLVELTEAALAVLSQDPDGFFLLVEAGQIDWAAHENDAQSVIQLTLGLDAAVAHAQLFTFGRPNTLLIVAADHETGGMRVNLDGAGSFRQDGPFAMPDGTTFWVDWTSGSHTGETVPVTAQGPYASMLEGDYSLTQIYETMFTYLIYGGLEISQ